MRGTEHGRVQRSGCEGCWQSVTHDRLTLPSLMEGRRNLREGRRREAREGEEKERDVYSFTIQQSLAITSQLKSTRMYNVHVIHKYVHVQMYYYVDVHVCTPM